MRGVRSPFDPQLVEQAQQWLALGVLQGAFALDVCDCCGWVICGQVLLHVVLALRGMRGAAEQQSPGGSWPARARVATDPCPQKIPSRRTCRPMSGTSASAWASSEPNPAEDDLVAPDAMRRQIRDHCACIEELRAAASLRSSTTTAARACRSHLGDQKTIWIFLLKKEFWAKVSSAYLGIHTIF